MPYLSKFALTKGIIEVSASEVDADGALMYRAPGTKPGWGVYVGKAHVHKTFDAALAKGEKMRAAKIASHEEAIASLRKLKI